MSPPRTIALVLAAATCGACVAGGATAATSFKPKPGNYMGSYTGGKHGPGPVGLTVGKVYLPNGKQGQGVTIYRWDAPKTCEDGSTKPGAVRIDVGRHGRSFSGTDTYTERQGTIVGKGTLTGKFTSKTKLKGTAQVVTTGPTPADNCKTGKVSFKAKWQGTAP
jgi:hypothetical protein